MRATFIMALLMAWTPSLMAQDLNPIKFCEGKKLQINLCDRLEWGNVEASAQNIKSCRERPSANTGASKCSTAVAAERESLRIKEGKVTRQIFTSSDLIDAGFGLPILAERIYYYSNGSEKKHEIITKPDHLCQYLGFSKAEEAQVDNTLLNGDKMRNKSMVVHDLLGKWNQPGVKIAIDNYDYDITDKDFNMVKSYKEITCIKVENQADKLLIKDVEAKLIYVGTEAPKKEEAKNEKVFDGSRAEKESVDDNEYDSSLTPFLYVPETTEKY